MGHPGSQVANGGFATKSVIGGFSEYSLVWSKKLLVAKKEEERAYLPLIQHTTKDTISLTDCSGHPAAYATSRHVSSRHTAAYQKGFVT